MELELGASKMANKHCHVKQTYLGGETSNICFMFTPTWADVLGGGNSNSVFIFTPKFGEDDPIWRAYFFQRGWFNHQIDMAGTCSKWMMYHQQESYNTPPYRTPRRRFPLPNLWKNSFHSLLENGQGGCSKNDLTLGIQSPSGNGNGT